MKKLKWIVIGLILVLIVLFLRGLTLNHAKKHRSADYQDKTVKTFETTEKSAEKTYRESAFDEAEKSLESAEELPDDKKAAVAETLKEAMESLKAVQNQSDVRLTYDNHLSITSPSRAQMVVTMFLAGYNYDESSLAVYRSQSSNVYQFTFSMTKSGAEALVLTGNFVTGTKQIELVNLYGTPEGVAN
ncbi:hypothetical protein [Streptococcus ferus]|uniref:hypothetical protein n=1 Tax=Streptococcus ferus TaxID=1345 RepID=UPI00235675B2|nr:hypothetical protein [Streptococcus ferus]